MSKVFALVLTLLISSSAMAEPRVFVLSKTLEVCFRGDPGITIKRRGALDATTGVILAPASDTGVDYLLDAHPDRRRFSKIGATEARSPLGPVKQLFYSDGREAYLVEKKIPDGPAVYMFFRYDPKNDRQKAGAFKVAASLFSCRPSDISRL